MCLSTISSEVIKVEKGAKEKAVWSNGLEFLMSCVSLSVGFGNIWRFPFTAYENGGGAFLIPYILLLFVVGKPFYYLEMIIGQFTGRSFIKVWNMAPAFRGVGWAQLSSMSLLVTYYCSLMALTLRYLISSFSSELPWSHCQPDWDNCIDSVKSSSNVTSTPNETRFTDQIHVSSSAELYFSKVILKERSSIDEGIGLPDWQLALCLLTSWLIILLVVFKGIKTSGKASYFLAIFPYVVLLALLGRAVTLPGAWNGILFFIKPNWSKLMTAKVWYEAVTQSFFSLSVCFGAIINYSSHNGFRHNLYKDVMIITTLDTITSLIAGFTIFGILGNLALEKGTDDIKSVVSPGTGLAFISYPDAIAKFHFVPQLFSVLFFIMLYVLGVGTAVGITSSIVTAVREQYPKLKQSVAVIIFCTFGFLVGLVYTTPGGQFMLGLVDYYGTSFVVFILATFEIIGVIWVYGLKNFVDDVEFMLGKRPSIYWRSCWLVITPVLLIAIFIYTMATLEPLKYKDYFYPVYAHAIGGVLLGLGVLQIPLWFVVAMIKNRGNGFGKMITGALSPCKEFGPRIEKDLIKWKDFKSQETLN